MWCCTRCQCLEDDQHGRQACPPDRGDHHPVDVEKIQRDCKWFTADTIRVALELFAKFGLVYQDEDGTLVMADHNGLGL